MTEPALPQIMGVLNVTPDSFSDGGLHAEVDAAIAHAGAMHAAGADIIDVGGESTRPGAGRVDAVEEIARTAEVVATLAAGGMNVSIDTTRAVVAQAALDKGANMINDVSGGLADPGMAGVAAEYGCRIVLMHWRNASADMYRQAEYTNVVTQVRDELSQRVDAMLAAGVSAEAIILDPGLGFSKRPQHNWELAARLDSLLELGFPVLFGSSRKSYLGALLSDAEGRPRPARERDAATLATSILAFEAGAWGVRVHDVAGTADARAVWRATRRAR